MPVSTPRTHASKVWIVELPTSRIRTPVTPGAAYLDEAPGQPKKP